MVSLPSEEATECLMFLEKKIQLSDSIIACRDFLASLTASTPSKEMKEEFQRISKMVRITASECKRISKMPMNPRLKHTKFIISDSNGSIQFNYTNMNSDICINKNNSASKMVVSGYYASQKLEGILWGSVRSEMKDEYSYDVNIGLIDQVRKVLQTTLPIQDFIWMLLNIGEAETTGCISNAKFLMKIIDEVLPTPYFNEIIQDIEMEQEDI